MTYDKTWIKHKEVLVDRQKGLAYIKVTLKNRLARQPIAKITEHTLAKIAEEGGAQMLKVISGGTLSNLSGESTGSWVIQIPSISITDEASQELSNEENELSLESEDMIPFSKKKRKSKNRNKIANEEEV